MTSCIVGKKIRAMGPGPLELFPFVVPRLFEEKWRDTVFWLSVARGAWHVVRGADCLVGTLSP